MATNTGRSGRTRARRRASDEGEVDEATRAALEAERADDRPSDPILVPHLDFEPMRRALDAEDKADAYPRVLETICGATDDSQAVEQYDGTLGVTTAFVASRQRAVAQVQWNSNLASIYTNPGNVSGVRWGTGTMISPDLFLTCGHLFDQTGGGWNRPRVNGTTNVISPQEIALNMHLNFNYQTDASGNMRTEESFAITQLIEYRLGGVDFAVCRIAGSPGNTYGWTEVSTVDAAQNDMLCIIGHPAGMPKRIEAGPATNFSGNQIQYNDIDTLGGNSGSGILHATSGQLVGVHTNGGCNSAGTGSNFGMRISVIRAQSATIRGLGTATAIIADIGVGTSFRDDAQATLAWRDRIDWDDLATSVLRDIQPTLPVRDKPVWDDIGTSLLRDVGGGGFKRINDVKAAALDKGGLDDPGFTNPATPYRPFVLSTPHHSPVLGGLQAAGGGMRQDVESALMQLEAALEQNHQMLGQLAAQYAALRAAYEESMGSGPPA